MKEPDRIARNKARLAECYPAFRAKVERVIALMEELGFRPRIQDGWRSPADQLKAYTTGHSKLRYGFHNVTSATGKPESLAVDMLDDNSPLASRLNYLVALAAVAARVGGIQTGILWGLPAHLRIAVNKAVATSVYDPRLKLGWDPTHLEPLGLTVSEARAGKRPTAGGSK